MSDKLNFDSLKEMMDSEYTSASDSDFDLESILRDFGEENEASVPSDEYTEAVTDIDDVEIKKPEGMSVTGAFESIRAEKSAKAEPDIRFEDHSAPMVEKTAAKSDIKPESHEIYDEIPQEKFFDTDTFNSIKEQHSVHDQRPLVSFAKGDGEEEDVEGEEIPVWEPTEEIDDYENEEEKEDVAAELKRIKASASFRSVFTFILMCLSGALYAALSAGFSVPGFDIGYDIFIYVPIMLAVSLTATVINAVSLWNGFINIFKLKCSSDSFLSLIFIFSSLLDICYICLKTPAKECIVFDFLYVAMLFFSINSKRIIAGNICRNFAVVSSDDAKMILDNRQNDELINDIIVDTGCSNDIAYAAKSSFVSDFIQRSFSDFDICSKHSAPGIIFLLFPIIAAAVNYFIIGSFTTSLKFAAGALCAVTPFLQGMNFAVSLSFNSKKTRKNGGVIVGAQSCGELNDIQTVVVDDSDVFSVALNGIRFYGDSTADKIILYLNSLYRVTGGPLKTLFGGMLSDDIKTLPRIDDIYYHESMGYSSLIDSKVFVAGNKRLMEHFGIEIDDEDFEIVYRQKSKHVLFAAYDGKLAGVFLLSYSLKSGVKRAFEVCEKDQLCVVIAEHDENTNPETLFYHYNTSDKLLFKILNFGNAQRCVQKLRLMDKTPSLVASRSGICGLAYALHGCKSVKFAVSAGRVIKLISSVIAAGLVTFLAFFSGMSSLFPLQVLVYQLLWSLPVMFVSFFSK